MTGYTQPRCKACGKRSLVSLLFAWFFLATTAGSGLKELGPYSSKAVCVIAEQQVEPSMPPCDFTKHTHKEPNGDVWDDCPVYTFGPFSQGDVDGVYQHCYEEKQ